MSMGRVSFLSEKKENKKKPRAISYEKIYELLDQGMNKKKVSEALSVSYGTVYHAIKVRNMSELAAASDR